MAVSFPGSFESILAADNHEFAVLYEIVLADSSVLRFSSIAVTWDGNAYTALGIRRSMLTDEMKITIPKMTITFDNINNTLRGYITPVDLLSDRRLTARLILKDAPGGSWAAESYVLFVGRVSIPLKVTEKEFAITVYGLIDATGVKMPRERTTSWCPKRFAAGVRCNYTQNTTANGAGVGSTTLNVQAGEGQYLDQAGREITIGSGDAVEIVSRSVDAITLDEARTWSDTDAVAYVDCLHSKVDCKKRKNYFEFGGFPLVEELRRRAAANMPWFVGGDIQQENMEDFTQSSQWWNMIWGQYADDWTEPSGELSNAETGIPMVFGRTVVGGKMIEGHYGTYDDLDPVSYSMRIEFYLISVGEIESVENFYVNDQAGDSQTLAEWHSPLAPDARLALGYYYRVGGAGVDATETTHLSTLLPQNTDSLSLAEQSYADHAYLITVKSAWDWDEGKVTNQFDVKGLLVQKYDSGGSTDGVPVWLQSGPWHIIEALLNPIWGLGRLIASTDIDWPAILAAAVITDAEITSVVADTTVNGTMSGADTEYLVFATEGFTRGMKVDVQGHLGTPTYVVKVISATLIELDQSYTLNDGDTITGTPPRYTSNGSFGKLQSPSNVVRTLADTFAGYLTYPEGKIAINAEGTMSEEAHFKDTGAAQGFEIVEGSFEWLTGNQTRHINRVEAKFKNGGLPGDDVVYSTDWDDVAANQMRIGPVLKLPFVDTRGQGLRLCALKLAKAENRDGGAKFTVGPIALRLFPGSRIKITAALPDWTAKDVRITERRIIGNDAGELMVQLTVEDYDANVYNDSGELPSSEADPDLAAIVLAVESETGGEVALTWEVSGQLTMTGPRMHYLIFAGDSPGFALNGNSTVGRAQGRRFVWTPTPTQIGTTVYFVIKSLTGVQSNEVSAVPSADDPADDQDNPPPVNMIYGSDFNDATDWTCTAPTLADVDPSGNSVSGDHDQGFTNPTNAYDNDDATYAEATISGGNTNAGHKFSFGAATKTGRAKVRVSQSTSGRRRSVKIIAKYSLDNGSTWVTFGETDDNYAKDILSEPLIGVDMSQFIILIDFIKTRASGTGTAHIYEVDFEDMSVPPYAAVGASQVVAISDGVTAADCFSVFPGREPEVSTDVLIESGSDNMCLISLKNATAGSQVNADVEVLLTDTALGTEWVMLTVPAATIADTWNEYVVLWNPGSDIKGQLEIHIRSLSTNAVAWDKPAAWRGDRIYHWMQHIEDIMVGRQIHASRWVAGQFARGRMTAGTVRSTV